MIVIPFASNNRISDQTLAERLLHALGADSNLAREAVDAVNDFTRTRMREESIFRRIMPPVEVNDEVRDSPMPGERIRGAQANSIIVDEVADLSPGVMEEITQIYNELGERLPYVDPVPQPVSGPGVISIPFATEARYEARRAISIPFDSLPDNVYIRGPHRS